MGRGLGSVTSCFVLQLQIANRKSQIHLHSSASLFNEFGSGPPSWATTRYRRISGSFALIVTEPGAVMAGLVVRMGLWVWQRGGGFLGGSRGARPGLGLFVGGGGEWGHI